MRKFGGFLAVVFAALAMQIGAVRGDDATTRGSYAVRIVLAGDSTTAVGSGWGPGFMKCLGDDVQCINMARGGRSSRSFIAEGRWKQCLDLKPDYVLIQFGHNDQPGHGAARESDPDVAYRKFINQYVDDARAAGIKPILITSMSRRQWGADGKIHSTLEPYAKVVREIAAEKNVPLIDLHAMSIELYERLGKTETNTLAPLKDIAPKGAKAPANADDPIAATQMSQEQSSATQPSPGKTFDGTHLNPKGSALVGAMVAGQLVKVVPDLGPYIHAPAQ
jgi:lysophospholipase L1-like esterase